MEKQNISLLYRVTEDEKYKDSNRENMQLMQGYLSECGISLDFLEDGQLRISLDTDIYKAYKGRAAGRHRKDLVLPPALREEFGHVLCRFSDIVWLKQTKTDREISELLGIPIATFSRHKKTVYESDYYKRLDRNRLLDRTYLESVRGNYGF